MIFKKYQHIWPPYFSKAEGTFPVQKFNIWSLHLWLHSGPILHLTSSGIMFLEIPYIFMEVEGWTPCFRLELKH